MAARPFNEWQTVDWIRYGGEVFAFILIFITFCVLCGSVHSSNIVHSCLKSAKDGSPPCDYVVQKLAE
uniref:Uncharacterized protein n=1 Tax=Panagrolaimus sp. PS1159 TaxID=55785 RepID=A0AC35G0F4_9BILA